MVIEGAAGYPTESWCATTTGATDRIPWSSFNTMCWDGSGTTYDGTTPLRAVKVMIPGEAVGDAPFDFCLNDLGYY